MKVASEPIHVVDDSELPHIVDEAAERPVRFERNGVVYRLRAETTREDEDDIWEGYDADAMATAIEQTSGSLPGNTDELIEFLYEARRLGSRPSSRP